MRFHEDDELRRRRRRRHQNNLLLGVGLRRQPQRIYHHMHSRNEKVQCSALPRHTMEQGVYENGADGWHCAYAVWSAAGAAMSESDAFTKASKRTGMTFLGAITFGSACMGEGYVDQAQQLTVAATPSWPAAWLENLCAC